MQLDINGKTVFLDDADYERIQEGGYSICTFFNGRLDYGVVSKGGVQEYLHRFVMNASDDFLIDHINFETLDCRKSNLRFVTKKQNQIHQRLRKDSTTGYKGVQWSKRQN